MTAKKNLTVHGLIIPADRNLPVQERAFAGLDDYQSAVGGYIEPVDIRQLRITVYVNEEGLLRQLPLNQRATWLWWYHVPPVREQAILVGDSIVVGLPDHDGDTTSVPAEVRDLLVADGPYLVSVHRSDREGWVESPAGAALEDYFLAAGMALSLLRYFPGIDDARITRRPITGHHDRDTFR